MHRRSWLSPIGAGSALLALGVALPQQAGAAGAPPGAGAPGRTVASPGPGAPGRAVTSPGGGAPRRAVVSPGAPASVRAWRTRTSVVVDGRDDDPIWRASTPTTGFRQFYPREDGAPTFETEFRVAYDEHNLYVFVRAFDPHPDSIMHAVTRRDVNSASDYVGITIDGFHDRRTGFEFVVNPDGAKRDCAVYADTLYDWSWDGIWEAAARVDSAGWTAEFRIPFSQIRYGNGRSHTFGFAVWRNNYRYYESSIWPLWRISRGGLMSQLGSLEGIEDIAPPNALALTPYVVARNADRRGVVGYGRAQSEALGGDVRWEAAPGVTLSAAVNPDFGQVEADPSVLNLSTAETFYPEKRPFFIEGGRSYQLDLACPGCADEGLFYSRRIGRAPQLLDLYGDAASPQATPIAAAAKLTGRDAHGLSIAALDAATERVTGAGGKTIEPGTNYAVVRATLEQPGDHGAIGFTATAVDRALDRWTADVLASSGYAGAIDFHRWLGGRRYGIAGVLAGSRVAGSRPAVTALQRALVHDYQRPDAGPGLDSARTSLAGTSAELSVGKYSGAVQWLAKWQRRSTGFDVNDVGYMARADLQSVSATISAALRTPHGLYRLITADATWSRSWTTSDGLPIGHQVVAEGRALLTNDWSVSAAMVADLGSFCDRCARGGPALRGDASTMPSLTVSGDGRRSLVPSLSVMAMRWDGGRSRYLSYAPNLALKLSSRLQGSLGGTLTLNHDHTQWLGNFTDSSDVTRYAFALLRQRTVSLNARASFAATPDLTLELYAAPFVSDGEYSEPRALSRTPGAASYDARFVPYTPPAASPAGFDVRQLRSDVVLRWEYRPGSTLFLVWTHGRDGADASPAQHSLAEDYHRLFQAHPDNTFVVKVSYWTGK